MRIDRAVSGSRVWIVTLAGALMFCAPLPGQDQPPKTVQAALEPGGQFEGKEPIDGVYVRDPAGAIDKWALAKRMEGLKEWNKSADLFQEVLTKYADRVVPSRLDRASDRICQYTTVTTAVQERLAHWPPEGLDVYRQRYEIPATNLLNQARPDDSAALNQVYNLYFVTDAGKQAGIRLMDLYTEAGEFPAAAWIGDHLLAIHPNLAAERAAVLYRTALAYHFSGNHAAAAERLATMQQKFPTDRGIVRGKDVILAESLAQDLAIAPTSANTFASDSWPMVGGDVSRGKISPAEGKPGARLYGITLPKPAWQQYTGPQRLAIEQSNKGSEEQGLTLGIMPVADKGELFFQDGTRLFALNLESGLPLSGWAQTYPDGVFTLAGTVGSQRMEQLSVTLTEREVLAIMGQTDHMGLVRNYAPKTESKLVCLDRQSGKAKWITALSQLAGLSDAERALTIAGSPLVVGEGVLLFASAPKQSGFEDAYAICLDLNTGKLRWSTYICTANSSNVVYGAIAPPVSDNASHPAYSNGRVYVQTNLGALAALDAYSGGIAWVNLYPSDHPTPEPAMGRFRGPGFNNVIPADLAGRSPRKPSSYNPVIVKDGYVFTMPTDAKYLFIYDAGTGQEFKRIDLADINTKWHDKHGTTIAPDAMENLDVLLGVSGDRLLLSGKKGVICLRWKNYDRVKFDPDDNENSVFWPEPLPIPVRGRGFIAGKSLYVPCTDRLYRIDVAAGKLVDFYPRGDRGWEETEGPGNVIATAEHVIVAGANSLNVYTDLALARTKLDAEVASAPGDPQPHLRYAEVMLAAGESDLAIDKLDEAIKLLGGMAAMQPGQSRTRVFTDALAFAQKQSTEAAGDGRARAAKLYDRAAAAAYTPMQQVQYRIARGKFAITTGHVNDAALLYQQILSDAAMRTVPMVDSNTGAPAQAAALAESALAALIKAAPSVYGPIQAQADAALKSAQGPGADSAGRLLEVARTYPNSTVASQAMLAAADAYEAAGNPRQAIGVLRQMWFKYPDGTEKARMLESMARNYFALPNRGEAATAALSRAAALPGDPKLNRPLKLPDGNVLAAATPLSSALDVVRKLRSQELAKPLVDLNVPILPPLTLEDRAAGKKPAAAFLPPTPDSVIDNVKSLVLPLADFRRFDRLVTWTSDGLLMVLEPGKKTPLFTSDAFKEEPKNCAWIGDSLVVWGHTYAARFNATDSQPAWRFAVSGLSQIEIARLTGDTPIVRGGNVDAQMNAQQQPIIMPQPNAFAGRRRGAMGRFNVAQNILVNNPPPLRPESSGPEQITEVHAVQDYLLLSTTAGRLISLDARDGRVAWQLRLTDRPVDRIVANDDFIVVRLTDDDTTVRLAAIDTATGEVRGNKGFAGGNSGGNVPVNMVLAADGTLVYTLTDRICRQDLYKPWTDDTSSDIVSGSGTLPYIGASGPDQLLIADGRILALADNGDQKYVNLFSLETGQPIPLRYRSAGGVREIDLRLTAGKSWSTTLRVVGPRLYVIGLGQVFGYNLDHPEQKTWATPPETLSTSAVNDIIISQKHLVIILEDLQQPLGVARGGAQPANLPPVPAAAKTPIPAYDLKFFRRTAISATDPAESGRLDFEFTVRDPAGILPTWQPVTGGLCYVTADNKLHLLRGTGTN
ncbi:MAG TPA: PQQ-binding-like beta-propeller repeat protein [Humisphaera sp.]|jgi:outer membrane protein assembly factor BamB|nr:PQQ-binding-like beta-propeller repeat protein [Humisphaera sp.]